MLPRRVVDGVTRRDAVAFIGMVKAKPMPHFVDTHASFVDLAVSLLAGKTWKGPVMDNDAVQYVVKIFEFPWLPGITVCTGTE